jgi:hypothetical protein
MHSGLRDSPYSTSACGRAEERILVENGMPFSRRESIF